MYGGHEGAAHESATGGDHRPATIVDRPTGEQKRPRRGQLDLAEVGTCPPTTRTPR
jgi:hypothetical protein